MFRLPSSAASPVRFWRAAFFLAMLGTFSSCDDTLSGIEQDATELKANAAEEAKRAGRAAEVELADFKRSANDNLASVDAKLAEIEKQMAGAREEAKAEATTQLGELRQERDALSRRIADASVAADAEWQATKRALSDAIAELGRDADEILDELGDDLRRAAE